MQRALAATVIIFLSCVPYIQDQKAPDARRVEARKAFDEGQRLAEAVRYAEAVPLIERALELSTANHGEAHPEVARCLDLLGNTRRQQGDFARAEPLLQRGLAIREAVYG